MSVIQPRTSVVEIFQGDYLARIRDLETRFARAELEEKKAGPRKLGEVPKSHQLADEHAALVAEAKEAGVIEVTVQALGRRRWRELVKEHPPREDVKSDQDIGVNEETFKDALVPESVVSPAFTEDDFDRMADIDFDRLYASAFALNRSPAAGPKALIPASRTNPESDAT